MLHIDHFVFNRFYENTYILWDDATREALVIDPGMEDAIQDGELDAFIGANGLRLTAVANTHLHVDHIMGERHLTERYGVPVYASPADAGVGSDSVARAASLGLAGRVPEAVRIDRPIADGDTVTVGAHALTVIAVPGHTPGSVAFHSAAHAFVIDGDTLLNGRVGMTDVDGADAAMMTASIKARLLTLPPDTAVWPGHGLATTVGTEALYNPYVR